MHRQSTRTRNTASAIALAFLLVLVPFVTQADDSSNGEAAEAAEATSGEMDDHEATSRDPDEMTGDSRDLDEMTVEGETMDARMAEPVNPESLVTGVGEPSDHEGTSTNLTDLRQASPDKGFEDIESPGQAEWETTTDPDVLVARRHLLRAQQRARNARTAYGRMMRRNYPRGAARIEIVNERDASMKALEGAKSALAASES